MVEGELNVALTILRVVRGWTQDDVARASGIPSSSISDYERGKKVPSLKTLERLTGAMGCNLLAVQRTQRFIQAVRSESLMSDLTGEEWPPESGSFEPEAVPAVGVSSSAALQWEIEQVSAEAGRAVARLTRTMLVLMSRTSRTVPEPE
jgi:transcriptional regulator with XRE-family HTH domain